MNVPDVTILYGSQTGNAEDLAKRVGLQAKSLGLAVLIQTMDDFQLKRLPAQKFLLFVCSTTGHGQEPENMKNLYNFVRRRDLPAGCLSNLRFAVYGLGDSSYAKFNYVAKILFKRLEHIGAQPIQELVLGDEQHTLGCDGIIYPKLDELWAKLTKETLRIRDRPENAYIATLYPIGDGPEPSDVFRPEFVTKYDMKTAHCTVNQRVTAESHFQDTRFLCFKADEPITYEPGDVCTILPANSDDNVRQLIETLNLNPEQRFSLRKRDPNYMVNYLYDFIPDGLRIHDLVKFYLDIQSVPKRSFFEFLWQFSDNQLERDKLKEFASTEGQEEMFEYCVQPKRSILEVLLDFPHTVKKITFEYLLDLIAPIKPRSFSIASAAVRHTNEIHLIVGVVKYQTRLRKTRKGLCSNYLASLTPVDDADAALRVARADPIAPSRLRFYIKRSSFKLPSCDNVPVVLIGPGLGIAPFRSFIEDRASRNTHASKTRLYSGCRYEIADFYFRDELERFMRDDLLQLRVAFSRQQPKRYVQDLLREDSELIEKLIKEQAGVIYVAGNSKLPEDLRTLFGDILARGNGDGSGESSRGEELVAQLEAQNRIQYDCW